MPLPPAAKGKLQHTTKLSARPDTGDQFCVTSVVWHGNGTLGAINRPSSTAYGTEGSGSAAVPLLQSLYVVTESQTLSFNVQTGLKVRGGGIQ